MKKKTLPIVAIIIMAFLGACNTEDDLLVNNPEQTRTLTLTASMPDDEPTTRIALEKKDDNTIGLKWEETDELQLLFVQGEFKKKSTVTVKNISENGKSAQFDIVLPTEIVDGTFNLYGVYGGGGLDNENPTNVILPANPGNATSLAENDDNSVQRRKDLILYFESANIDVANPKATVSFQHLGSLFNITLKNKVSTPLVNIKEVRLVGVGGDGLWAYNNNEGAQSYNLITGEFENQGTAGNYISFATTSNTLAANGELTFWGWYPPLPNKNWPELKLELWNETTVTSTSINSKPARSSSTAAGKAFYFYAIWNGSKISFTDSSFTPEFFIEEGGLDAALGEDKDNIDAMALKGSVNNDDFQVMRNMTSLRRLDLSAVTVAGNKIPDYAFGGAPTGFPFGKTVKAPTNNSSSIQKNTFTPPTTSNTKITEIVLPPDITSIGKYAFAGCTGLKGDLIIPNHVTIIEEGAFYGCTNYHGTLTLSENLETIGRGAFYNCSKLKGNLLIPDGVTTIEDGIFYDCKALDGTLTLPANTTSIGNDAFYNCNKLKGNLTIPQSVTTIGERAFAYCYSLNGTLTLPSNMTSIGIEAFYACGSLTGNLTIPAGITIVESGTFAGCNNLHGTLTLPSTLQTIGENAFYECSSLTGNLILPNTLSLIEGGAFINCEGLEGSLTIHSNIASIGFYSFQGCRGLTSLNVENASTIIGAGAFANCVALQSASLPNETTFILPEVFAECNSLTSINIPTNLKIIGQSAFKNCDGLTSINLPQGLLKIKDSAFSGCYNLTISSIPNSVTSIGDEAFMQCSSLTGDLDLSNHLSLTNIGNYAFAYCEGFNGILKLPPNITTIGNLVDYGYKEYPEDIADIPADGDVDWPNMILDAQKGHVFYECSNFTGNLVIPEGVTKIEDASFQSCTGLQSLTLPSTLIEIENNAFSYCDGLKGELTLPNLLTSIEFNAFGGCTGFTSLTIGQNINYIGYGSFFGCSGLTGKVIFPISLTNLRQIAFSGCDAVEAFRFPHLNPIQYLENMLPAESTIEVPTDAVDIYKTNAGWAAHTIVGY